LEVLTKLDLTTALPGALGWCLFGSGNETWNDKLNTAEHDIMDLSWIYHGFIMDLSGLLY